MGGASRFLFGLYRLAKYRLEKPASVAKGPSRFELSLGYSLYPLKNLLTSSILYASILKDETPNINDK